LDHPVQNITFREKDKKKGCFIYWYQDRVSNFEHW